MCPCIYIILIDIVLSDKIYEYYDRGYVEVYLQFTVMVKQTDIFISGYYV